LILSNSFLVKKSFAVLLITTAVFTSYAPALRDGFVWDDTALILRDPLIRSWRLIPEGFNHFLFVDATASDFYRPIQRLTYTLDYAAFALRPWPYHLTSIICHVAAAIAVLFLAEEFLLIFGIEPIRRRLIALAATLVWSIHPIQSAAVVYISGRADPLAAGFGFLGFYLILRGLRASGRHGLLFLVAATVALLLSILSKETGLIIFLLALTASVLRKNWVATLKTAGVVVFAGLVYLSLRLPGEHFATPVLRAPPPLLVRPILVARAFAEYAGLIVFPFNLHMDRNIETQPSGFGDVSLTTAAWRELQTLLGILLILAAAYWMIRAHKRNPAVFSCLVLAAISYLPFSGILVWNASVAEHWLYLPTAFLFLAAATQAAEFVQSKNEWQRSTIRLAAISIATSWLVFLGVRTFVRTFDWKDQRIFLERTIASGGDSARMFINLGDLELEEGKLKEAKTDFETALRKEPGQPLAILNLAAVALKQNDFKAAREQLQRAIKMPLVEPQAHEFLAVLENKEEGRVDLLRLRLAARTGPPNWSIERRYVKVLDETGATAQAIGELQACLRREWYRAESWKLLSQLLAKSGRRDEALHALNQARAYDVHLDIHGGAL
jgi:tetratricopeptide (TPR) repeat protein